MEPSDRVREKWRAHASMKRWNDEERTRRFLSQFDPDVWEDEVSEWE